MDRNQRDLERAVAVDPDDVHSRYGLTMSMARSQNGIVAYWPGEEKPHAAAVKVAIGFEVLGRNGISARPETVGWILAVTTAADVLEIATLRGSCRLIELATWRTMGLFGQGGTIAPKRGFKIQSSTTDALGRPRAAGVNAGSDSLYGAHPSAMRVVDDLHDDDVANVAAFVEDGTEIVTDISESLYDREIVLPRGTVSTYPFFQNTRAYAEMPAGTKNWAQDTNLLGLGGSLPHHHSMIVNGMSMLLDATVHGEPAAIPDDVLTQIHAHSYVRLVFGSSVVHDFPSRLVFPRERGVDLSTRDRDDVIRFSGTSPAIYPFVVPFVLRATWSFTVLLTFPILMPLQQAMERAKISQLGIMCVLHGVRFRPRPG